MHLGAAQLLGRDDLAGGRLHDRRPAEEDGALALDDDRLVGHRRHVGAAGGAGAHDAGELRDAERGQVRLVVEDAAEMLAIGKHFVLAGQVGAAGIDQVDAGQAVLQRDFLRAQVLLHRHREVGAALDGGVVGDDHALAPGDAADAGDDGGRRHVPAIHAVGGELADLQEGRARIEQRAHALARKQLAARGVLVPRRLVAASRDRGGLLLEVFDQAAHARGVGAEFLRARIELALDRGHQESPSSALPITSRWMSLAPS